MESTVYTVGHSTHSIERFIALLSQYDVNALCDVRSAPYSRFNPQFNKEALQASLKNSGIQYVFLGRELGARSDNPACYIDGRVSYERLSETELFNAGIDRVETGAKDFAVALMCAEKEPLDCHRTLLVARALEKRRLRVKHILADGTLEDHDDTMKRLVKSLHLDQGDLFADSNAVRDKAYAVRGSDIAYVPRAQEAGE